MLRNAQWVQQRDMANTYGIPRTNISMMVYHSKARGYNKHLCKDGFINIDYINRNLELRTRLYNGMQNMYYEILELGIVDNENQLAMLLSELTGLGHSNCGTYLNTFLWKPHNESMTSLVIHKTALKIYRAMKKILRKGK